MAPFVSASSFLYVDPFSEFKVTGGVNISVFQATPYCSQHDRLISIESANAAFFAACDQLVCKHLGYLVDCRFIYCPLKTCGVAKLP